MDRAISQTLDKGKHVHGLQSNADTQCTNAVGQLPPLVAKYRYGTACYCWCLRKQNKNKKKKSLEQVKHFGAHCMAIHSLIAFNLVPFHMTIANAKCFCSVHISHFSVSFLFSAVFVVVFFIAPDCWGTRQCWGCWRVLAVMSIIAEPWLRLIYIGVFHS